MIGTKEETLFAGWAKACTGGFVKDGVVSEDEYAASTLKLLFVLKEPNDADGGDWDLREVVRGGQRSPTWSNVARWTAGIRRLPEMLPWSELENPDVTFRQSHLRSIAAMNLKKSAGTSVAKYRPLVSWCRDHADRISHQLELYSPDLTILCGSDVTDIYWSIVEKRVSGEWRRTSRGVDYLVLGNGSRVISYVHPEARVVDNLLHYGLMDAVQEIHYERTE